MTDKKPTCCFTGHRLISNADKKLLTLALQDEIERLYLLYGIRHFITGGALGFDTMAALAVLQARQQHPDITLQLMLPCESQDRDWTPAQQQIYRSIKKQANAVTYVGLSYSEGCMLRRNRLMVNRSDICVAYLRSPRGGTAYTVRYAKKKGICVISLPGS